MVYLRDMRLEVISILDLRDLDPDEVLEWAESRSRSDMAQWLGESGICPTDSEIAMSTGVVMDGPETRVAGHGLFALGLVQDIVELLGVDPKDWEEQDACTVESNLGEFELGGFQYVAMTGWMGAALYILKKMGGMRQVREVGVGGMHAE